MSGNRWDSSSDEEIEESNQKTATDRIPPITASISSSPPSLAKTTPCRSIAPFPSRSIENYERISKIDEGAYGIVWKAREVSSNTVYALKQVKFPPEITKEGFPIAALREINVLRTLSHPNILSVKEMVVGDSPQAVFMVMEHMEMDLRDACENLTEPLTQGELKRIMQQVLSALEMMHSHNYFHRDLKTSNILVARSGKVTLCDFGLTRTFDDPRRSDYTPLVITLFYRPPELLMGTTTYGPEVDIWSVGCIFAELITREQLFIGNGEIDQLSKIFSVLGPPSEDNWTGFSKLKHANALRWSGPKRSRLREKFPANMFEGKTFLAPNGFRLLESMLSLDPAKRITAEAAVGDDYFSEAPPPSDVRWNWD